MLYLLLYNSMLLPYTTLMLMFLSFLNSVLLNIKFKELKGQMEKENAAICLYTLLFVSGW